MVKGARQQEWPRHLSTHTHTHWTLPTTMSVLETPFDKHVISVYQTHTCMQAPIPTLCISAIKTHNKGSRTRPIMSTLMPRSGIPVICSRATLSCDSSYSRLFLMGAFSYLQVMITYIRAWMSLKFSQIRPRTIEIAALKRVKNLCFHFFSLCIMALR